MLVLHGAAEISKMRRKATTTITKILRGDILNRDWTGNKASAFSPIGATGHSTLIRVAGDFYATDPRAVDALEYAGKLPKSKKIWECAAGQGDLSEALIKRGFEVISTDLYDRGYCEGGTDFLKTTELLAPCIFTNPPYVYGTEFCTHAINLGAKEVYMFLKLQFLDGKRRYRELYSQNPPARYCNSLGEWVRRETAIVANLANLLRYHFVG